MNAFCRGGHSAAPFDVVGMEEKIIDLLKRRGPLTGSEIRGALGSDSFQLWKSCSQSSNLVIRMLGTRYLRLDQRVDGFARLSPSILREFLTYSVIGLSSEAKTLEQKAQEIISHINDVSKYKFNLAQSLISTIMSRLESPDALDQQLCVIIAGDIVYDMAHDVPRPERSTGRMVTGSDLDLIVILDDTVPEDVLQKLDSAIYQEKYRNLINPSVKEEIDYIVKRFERVREQVAFDDFKKMVACKIIQEGKLLYGSESLFKAAKSLLNECGVTRKLDAMQQRAEVFRKDAEEYLLNEHHEGLDRDNLYLFYTAEESEEFE